MKPIEKIIRKNVAARRSSSISSRGRRESVEWLSRCGWSGRASVRTARTLATRSPLARSFPMHCYGGYSPGFATGRSVWTSSSRISPQTPLPVVLLVVLLVEVVLSSREAAAAAAAALVAGASAKGAAAATITTEAETETLAAASTAPSTAPSTATAAMQGSIRVLGTRLRRAPRWVARMVADAAILCSATLPLKDTCGSKPHRVP